MESLVLSALVVVLGTLAAAAVSGLLAWRPRRTPLGRALAVAVGAATALSGAWLASLQIGPVLDTLGVLACASGCIAALHNTKAFATAPVR